MPREPRQNSIWQIGYGTKVATKAPRCGHDPYVIEVERARHPLTPRGEGYLGVVPGMAHHYEYVGGRAPRIPRQDDWTPARNHKSAGGKKHFAEDDHGVARVRTPRGEPTPELEEEAGARARRFHGLNAQLRVEYRPPGCRDPDPGSPPRGYRGENITRNDAHVEAMKEEWQQCLDQWHDARPRRANSPGPQAAMRARTLSPSRHGSESARVHTPRTPRREASNGQGGRARSQTPRCRPPPSPRGPDPRAMLEKKWSRRGASYSTCASSAGSCSGSSAVSSAYGDRGEVRIPRGRGGRPPPRP